MMERYGRILGLLIAMMVILSCVTVVGRYVFDYVSIPLQEIALYLHSTAFMLGVIYTWHHDKHVRVDVFYGKYSESRKKRLNQLGHIILAIPLFIYLVYVSIPYVTRSWEVWEKSAATGGLPLVWLLKSLLVLMPIGMLFLVLWKVKENKE